MRGIKNAARSVKEVVKDGVNYLHVDSSHLFERRSENHFKVLLGCLLEHPSLEQEAAPVHTLNAVKICPPLCIYQKEQVALCSQNCLPTRHHF